MANDLSDPRATWLGAKDVLAGAKFIPKEHLNAKGYHRGDEIYLGRTETGKAFGYYLDTHMMTVAGTQGGKGISCLMPNLLDYQGSVVVVDPKGELAARTARYRRDKLGQKVIILDPCGVVDVPIPQELRGSFNLLEALTPDNPLTPEFALLMAHNLVHLNTDGTKDHPHFSAMAQKTLYGALLYMAKRFPAERRHLTTLRDLVSLGDDDVTSRAVAQARKRDPDYMPSPALGFEALLDEWWGMDDYRGSLKRASADILAAGREEFGSIRTTTSRAFEFLETEQMSDVLMPPNGKCPQFHLPDIRNQKQRTSLYLVLPPALFGTYGKWFALTLELLIRYIQRTPFDKDNEWPILMMVDEFAQLGTLPSIVNTLSFSGSYGLRVWLVLQSLEQLKKLYPNDMHTIMGACELKQFFAVDDYFTAETLSKYLGTCEVTVPNLTLSRQWTNSRGGQTSTASTIGASASYGRTEGESASHSPTNGHRTDSIQSGKSFQITAQSSTTTTVGQNWQESHGGSESISLSKQTRPLMRPEELMKAFNSRNLAQLILSRSHDPSVLVRTPYFADPHFAALLGEYNPALNLPLTKQKQSA